MVAKVEFYVASLDGDEMFIEFSEGPMAGERIRVGPEGSTLGRGARATVVLPQDGTVRLLFTFQGSPAINPDQQMKNRSHPCSFHHRPDFQLDAPETLNKLQIIRMS